MIKSAKGVEKRRELAQLELHTFPRGGGGGGGSICFIFEFLLD